MFVFAYRSASREGRLTGARFLMDGMPSDQVQDLVLPLKLRNVGLFLRPYGFIIRAFTMADHVSSYMDLPSSAIFQARLYWKD